GDHSMAPIDRTASALLLRLDPLHLFGELPKWTIDSRRPVNRVSRARRAALDATLRLADIMLAAANQRLLNRVQCVPEVRVPILPAPGRQHLAGSHGASSLPYLAVAGPPTRDL